MEFGPYELELREFLNAQRGDSTRKTNKKNQRGKARRSSSSLDSTPPASKMPDNAYPRRFGYFYQQHGRVARVCKEIVFLNLKPPAKYSSIVGLNDTKVQKLSHIVYGYQTFLHLHLSARLHCSIVSDLYDAPRARYLAIRSNITETLNTVQWTARDAQ